MKKILIVCESISENASGGRVIRYLTNLLKTNSKEVIIVVISNTKTIFKDDFIKENKVYFLFESNKKEAMLRHFIKSKLIYEYTLLLKKIQPDIIHFASFLYSKSKFLIKISNTLCKKVVLQPWIFDFFCFQGYAYRNGKSCLLCIEKGFSQSFINKCATIKNTHSIISRKLLQSVALKACSFLSSSQFMDDVLLKYGVEKDKIYRFPIPYEIKKYDKYDDLIGEDYFIFYGQAKEFKGIDVLINIFSEIKKIKLKIYPTVFYQPKNKVSPNVEVINNITWNNGLEEAIKNAKAVILPTLWPTTTEYALYEAMNFSKPIIAFNVGAHRELLIHRYNAMLSDLGDEEKFVENIKEINKNKVLREKIGKNALQTVMQLNDPKVLYDKLIKVYSQ